MTLTARQFWAPGNMELFALSGRPGHGQRQLFVISFAKSATTSQPSPVRQLSIPLDCRRF